MNGECRLGEGYDCDCRSSVWIDIGVDALDIGSGTLEVCPGAILLCHLRCNYPAQQIRALVREHNRSRRVPSLWNSAGRVDYEWLRVHVADPDCAACLRTPGVCLPYDRQAIGVCTVW